MNISVKALHFTSWISLIFMALFGLLGPTVMPIYLKMQGLPEFTQNPWLIVPPAVISMLGCWLMIIRKSMGYALLITAALLAFVISPLPKQTLIPLVLVLVLVSIPFGCTLLCVVRGARPK